MKKVALISYGCAKNLVDSEVMLGYLDKAGYKFVSNPEEADIIIVNTCGFIQPAKKEALEGLENAVRLKESRKTIRIVASGCYVQRYRDNIENQFPQVDAWIGVNDFDKIVHAVENRPFQKSETSFLYSHASPRIVSTPPSWAYLKISEGCSHECSFCSIPLIKGTYRSRLVDSIIKEARYLASRGVKEINLISQDSSYYGKENNHKDGLAILLRKLLQVKGIEWIRVLYGYPEEIAGSLLEVMKEKKICSYFDIPFQHADAKIIRQMRRGMSEVQALKLIDKIRNEIPQVTIRTSLIVGFPGEGDKEFETLKQFVRKAEFDHLGVFTYSREEGTPSFSMGDTVNEREKERRRDDIMKIQAEISYKNNRKYLQKITDVLIEGTAKGDSRLLIGRTSGQAPEVDGVVFISLSRSLSEVVNSIQKVEITDCDEYDLYGKLIQ